MTFTMTIGDMELSPFTARSSRELYCIRNHGSVRSFMANPELIPYRAHRAWVQKHLIDGRDLLLFLVRPRKGARAIGFTQLRIQGDTAEIGVVFREAFRHRTAAGLATVATLYLAFGHLSLSGLVSYVLPEHQGALVFNKAFGAQEVASDKPGMIKLTLSRAACLSNAHYTRVFSRIRERIRIEPHFVTGASSA